MITLQQMQDKIQADPEKEILVIADGEIVYYKPGQGIRVMRYSKVRRT
jgi:hypothetical protein